jgi:hypothetical protein
MKSLVMESHHALKTNCITLEGEMAKYKEDAEEDTHLVLWNNNAD